MVRFATIPTFADSRDAALETLRDNITGWQGVPSDPGYYFAEYISNRDIQLKTQLNETAISVTVLATGSDLDDVIPIVRLAGETDANYLARYRSVLASHSGDTEELVGRQILSVDGVSDGEFIRHPGYNADIYIQGAGYSASDGALRTAVSEYMNSPSIKPIFADYTVQGENRRSYTLNGEVEYGPNITEAELRTRIEARLNAAILDAQRLNGHIANSFFVVKIWEEGLVDVEITVSIDAVAARNFTYNSGTLADNQFQRRTAGSNLQWKYKPGSTPFGIANGDKLKMTISADEFTGIASSVVRNQDGTIDVDITSPAPVGNFNAQIGDGKTFVTELETEHKDIPSTHGTVWVGAIGDVWKVWRQGSTKPGTGTALIPAP